MFIDFMKRANFVRFRLVLICIALFGFLFFILNFSGRLVAVEDSTDLIISQNVASNIAKIPIYVVTPTYRRPEQLAELTRFGQTLALAKDIHWIIVEDAEFLSPSVAAFLARIDPYFIGTTHLFVATPANEKLTDTEARWRKVRGVHQRNAALSWLRTHFGSVVSKRQQGVVYFADDDNSYDLRLFDKMRSVKKVGVWPVGLVGKLLYEGPICDSRSGRLTSWRTGFRPDRFCPCDMAGFAVSLSLVISNHEALFSTQPGIGMLEADFLSRLVLSGNASKFVPSQRPLYLEPVVCDEIFVWHTTTKQSDLTNESKIGAKFPASLLVY